MVPRIFVSSTIRDLLHVRDAIRELVVELGYTPVMSDYGEVGYLPDKSAADSCYDESRDCNLGILIVGKRYGDDSTNGLSVTENEYGALLKARIPIVTVIEKDVLTYRAHYVQNHKHGQVSDYPGMDRPQKTFDFVSSVMKSDLNNGVMEFSHVGEARDYIRKQFAHIFGSLLRQRSDTLRTDVKDVLAAIHSLRQEFLRVNQDPNSTRFLLASRHLLDDSAKHYKQLLEQLYPAFELAVQKVLEIQSFDELIANAGYALELNSGHVKPFNSDEELRKTIRFGSHWSTAATNQWIGYYVLKRNVLVVDPEVMDLFRSLHHKIRRESGL